MSAIWWIVVSILIGIFGLIVVDEVMLSLSNEKKFWKAVEEMDEEDSVDIIIWY